MLSNPRDIFKILQEKQIEVLCHANTVLTSLSFLEMDSLLSRDKMEQLGLPKTIQRSDSNDKLKGIYNDIFLDTLDNHIRFKRENYYGPVLFEINSNILSSVNAGHILITKENPDNWWGDNDKYFFKSLKEIRESYFGNSKQHIIYRDTSGILNINGFLNRLVLDNPNKELVSDINIYDVAEEGLIRAMNQGNLSLQVTNRDCQNIYCNCHTSYDKRLWYLSYRFMPIDVSFKEEKEE